VSHYQLSSLAECCEIVSGATPSTSVDEYWGGDIFWATPKDLSDQKGHYISETPRKLTSAGLRSCAATLLPANSVLFSSRAPIGHVAVNTVPMATNQGFKSFIPRAEKIDAKFLFHWLRANRTYLESLGNGATFKEVSKATVAKIEIPLPPLPEQRRIAAILDQADALRAKRREALAQLDKLTQAIFVEMFGDLESNVNGLPFKNLEELCVRVTDGTHQSPKWEPDGIPFLFISNILNGEISYSTEKFISRETYHELTRRCAIDAGDVLFTTVGSYGNTAVVSGEREFCFQRHIAHIKPNAEKLDSSFCAAMLESPSVRRQIDKVARGVAQKTINLADLKALRVFSPPIEKQKSFTTKQGLVKSIKAIQAQSLREFDTLFSSLQHRAFRGEL
jgi:type I restriction enzyme S subunit